MLEFIRRNRVLLSTSFFLLCSLALLSVNARHPGRVDPLGRAFLEVMAPLQRAAAVLGTQAGALWSDYVALVGVERENHQLRTRLHGFEERATAHRELELMNRRLKHLLALQHRLATAAVAAEVVGRDASASFQSLTLDKGERDGIKPGMPVLAAEGVVGTISSTSPHAARVLLLVDPNSGIDVLVQRTRVRGIVSGQLEQGAILKYVKRADDVQVGDRIITSGLDGIFPKGVPVGHVARVARKDRGLFIYAEVTPSADVTRLEEVLVTPPSGAALGTGELSERSGGTADTLAAPRGAPSVPAPNLAEPPAPRPDTALDRGHGQ